MKKNKYFHFGLYLEGIRQLKLTGILMMVIFSIEAILVPVGYFTEINSARKYLSISQEIVARNVTGINIHPILVLAFVLVAPIMTLSIFNFLNKRNASDFYHSLPYLRSCIFISFMAAVATWLVMIIAGSTLISMVAVLIFHRFLALNIPSLLMLALNCLIASLLVSSVIATAMSVTGTRFNNLILSGLLLFLPRLLIALIAYILTNALPLLVTNRIFPLVGSDYNIVTGCVFGVFDFVFGSFFDVSPTIILTSGKAAIYTFCLAFVYFTVGCFLFGKRPSESASIAASSRKLQTLFRITVTVAYSALITCVLFHELVSGQRMTMPDFFRYTVFYLIGILIFFIYELITTKKWKNLLRAVPSLGIVVLLNGVIICALFGAYSIALNYTPSVEQIKSISVLPDQESFSSSATYSFNRYVEQEIGTIEITDHDTILMISCALFNNVKSIKNKQKPYAYLDEKKYQNEYELTASTWTSLTCKIRTSAGSRYRNVYISSEDMQMIVSLLRENESVRQLYQNLPECREQGIAIYQQGTELTQKQLKEVYDIMRYEIAVSDFSKWYNRLHGISVDNVTENGSLICSFVVSVVYDMKTISVWIPLYDDICPQAANKYRRYTAEAARAEIDTAFEMLTAMENKEVKDDYTLVFELFDPDHDRYAYIKIHYRHDSEKSNDVSESLAFLLQILGREAALDTDGTYGNISIDMTSVSDGDSTDYPTGYPYTLSVCVTLPKGIPDDIPDVLWKFGEIKLEDKLEGSDNDAVLG